MTLRVVSIRFLVGTKRPDAFLDSVAEDAASYAFHVFKSFHIETLGTETLITKPTKDEAIRLTPLRRHYADSGGIGTACSALKSVPASRSTLDWDKVTCKQCLKKRPQPAQVAMFQKEG
jgi:hypothetical protein